MDTTQIGTVVWKCITPIGDGKWSSKFIERVSI